MIVLKNLTAHRKRNRKTALTFSLALAFVIYLNIYSQVNVNAFVYQTMRSYGSHLRVEAQGWRAVDDNGLPSINVKSTSTGQVRVATHDFSSSGYHAIQMKDEIEGLVREFKDVVKSMCWISASMMDVLQVGDDMLLTNIGHSYQDLPTGIIAWSPSYPETALMDVVEVDRKIPTKFHLWDDHYSAMGSASIITSYHNADYLNIEVGENGLIEVKEGLFFVNQSERVLLATLTTAAGVFVRKAPTIQPQATMVSFPSWLSMSQKFSPGQFNSIESIPMRSLYIKFFNKLNNQRKKLFISSLSAITQQQIGVKVDDFDQAVAPVNTATSALQYFFSLTTLFSLIIGFFSLTSSSYTNIHEQSKEIGIMLAVGMTKFELQRAYAYEGIALILSSSFMGVATGTFIAWTITLQRMMMVALPLTFPFPWWLLFIITAVALVAGTISSQLPLRQLLSLPITSIMRTLM